MGQALYRNYRPKKFSEVIGQEHITKTLENAIRAGKISHAYLFTGPKGVGKTSVARILAHEVNQLTYKDDSIHLDIIEIDAASNRRIDEIRELRERVRIAPTSAKYKVYIIDEVHMLTREAFNALLKTLEEPPSHCIFILATTEAHKLPDTIISRTQRFEFKPVGPAKASKHLGYIAKNEKIDINPEALDLLAEFGDGSFRDSISYLDQLSTHGSKITEAQVREVLGLPTAQQIDKLIESLMNSDPKELLENLGDIKDQGVNAAAVAAVLAKQLRHQLITGGSANWVGSLLKELIEVPASRRPFDNLEIVLLEACGFENKPPADSAQPTVSQRAKPVAAARQPEIVESPKQIESRSLTEVDLSQWDEVVAKAKSQAASIYTALKLAQPRIEDQKLLLAFRFPLHQKKLSTAKSKDVISRLVEDVFGQKFTIDCVVDKGLQTIQQPAEPRKFESDPSVSAISNIFGATEVLES
ncbi:MAG TPA: DNA polymerase III subunit gamma/tau [Candidatus Saccharimonadales bacterium]|nr:DNA polymerase III subunit gamma/tau [Candidatus Saccharimonadales bacterium]